MNNKLMNNIETFLQSPKGYKKSWVRTLLGVFVATVIFIVVLVIAFQEGPMSGSTSKYGQVLSETLNAPLINGAAWISVTGFCLFALPIIYIFSVWMIGINQVSKSRYFHLFMWIIAFIAILLAIIAMLLLIRAGITNTL